MVCSDVLKEHIAIVTGAARGIGEAIARHLCDNGCSVVLADCDEKALNETFRRFEACGFKCVKCVCDVSDPKQLKQLFTYAEDNLGHITLLFNNASIGYTVPFLEVDHKELNKYFNTNVFPMLLASQLAHSHFVENAKMGKFGKGSLNHGWIFNMSSFDSKPSDILRGGGSDLVCYEMCGGAINNLTYATAQFFYEEKRREGAPALHTRVIGLAPYIFSTLIAKQIAEGKGGSMEQGAQAMNPSDVLGDPNVLGKLVVSAIKGEIEWKTGNIFTVDGNGEWKNLRDEQLFPEHREGKQVKTAQDTQREEGVRLPGVA